MSTLRYDPFTWRLDQLHITRAHHPHATEQAAALVDELLVAEAEELAHGRRHLTVEHGTLDDVIDHDQRDRLLDAIDAIAEHAEWQRVSASTRCVTVTVAGQDTDTLLDALTRAAVAHNPGGWRITTGARPASD